ncbi:T9SS type A sorting domain-containing protein [Flavobacterium sp.]|uniref:T9SS type A sorting domain-containing protein n=1 Tax=Flavobacterium sp. TaxID=239 RepID=UPI0038FD144F
MNNNYNSNRTRQIPIWKSMFAIIVMFLTVTVGNAQVTTNGGSGLNPTYPDLASAITALNGATISSPVVITLDPVNPQTAPAGGYAITAQGDATNTILIQGGGNTITASNALVAGTLTDAIFKLIGADYVTLQNFTMQENAANLTTAAATNNMTEWGVALLYATATNGAQNNTIQNNTISLNRVYQNTFGIYSNTRHTAIVVTVIADVTSAAGANSFNKVYGNAISNVNYGTVFIGSGALTASSFMDNGNDIGGSSVATGNTYTNWGGVGTVISGYVSVTGSNYCIFDNNQYNDNISYNTITSFASASGLTMGGILKNYSTGTTGQPTGTITSVINNNTVTITNNPTVAAGSIIGINNQGLSPLLATATMNMNNNIVQNCVLGGSTVTTGGLTAITNLSLPGTMNMNGNSVINNAIAATTSTTGVNAGIANSGAAGTLNMNNNTVRSLSSTATTTGQIQGIVNSGAIVTALNMNNNFLGNATSGFCSRSVASTGSTFGITTSGGAATCNTSIQSNDIRGISYTVASSGTQNLIQNTAVTLTQNISFNTFTSLVINTTGSVTFISNSVTRPANAICNVNNNAIVGSFSKTGAGGTLTFYNSNGSTPASGTENNLNNNFSNITVTGATAIAGWVSTDGSTTSPFGPGKNVSNNTFNNITGGTSSITILSVAYSNNALTTNNVSSNTISNITNGASIVGIASATAPQNFFGNTINSLTATGASTVSAIQVTGGTTQNIYKNKIYNVESNNAAGVVNGILVSGGTTVTAYNNIIGDLRTPVSNLANPLNGINVTGGTTVNAYNNTVMLNASSTGVLFGSSAVSVSTTPTVALRNNIFVNNSTATGAGLAVAYRRSSTTLTSYDAASNNNLFFASNIFSDGTNTDATLAAYKTRVATRDALSVTENPVFASTLGSNSTFLHFNVGTITQAESGAATIGVVTDDFDGDVRNATTPDIGADEFVGVQGLPADTTPPTISHLVVTNQCAGGVRTVSATITDASGVPTLGAGLPVAYYAINAGAYTAVTGASMGAGVYDFAIGTGSVVGDVINYYFVAQDNVATPNTSALPSTGAAGFTVNPPAVATAPTTTFSYSVKQLNGVYTVGIGGVYTTLTAAVAAYNSTCLTGPVTFSLIDATYPGETFPITINQNADASAINTLTIKPAVGVSPTISGSNASSIFLLNGADYVTIDGSNGTTANAICPLSTASRDLTVTNTNTGTSSAVIWLATNVANGATNNKVINTNVVGNSNTTTLVALGSGSSTISMSSLGTLNNNNSFVNNAISKTQFGIYSQGASAGSKNSGTIINQNIMNTVAPNNVAKGAIVVGFENNIAIVANAISEIAQTSSPDVFGISLGVQGISTSTFTGNEVTNATVTKNAIGNIRNTGTFSAIGICVAPATSGTNTITNNMISGVSANGTSGDFSSGIFVGGGAGSTTQIYHNTVTMIGTQTGGSDKSYALAIAGSDPIVDVRNNILINTQNNGSGNNYAVAYGYATFANLTSSYNDYVVGTGATFFIGATGSISAPTNQLDIAALQTATGKDSNAQNITPAFTSATDLHITDGALDNLGTPIATVVDDFNCEARSATTPDMGADEFTFLSVNQFNLADGFKAYPNPVSSILNIEYTGELSNVTVYNLLGQQVLTKKVTATSTQIDMSILNAGTYLVKVESNDVSKTIKVVKR